MPYPEGSLYQTKPKKWLQKIQSVSYHIFAESWTGILSGWVGLVGRQQIICDMVETPRTGLFAILDEGCITVGGATDAQVLSSMDRLLGSHAHYSSRGVSFAPAVITSMVLVVWRWYATSDSAAIMSCPQTNAKDKVLRRDQDFRIAHFAGDVIYTIDGFIEKNKDTLFQVSSTSPARTWVCVCRSSGDGGRDGTG